ncbi:MAG: alpha/beta hydrolase [Gammaproteobacteria bacterium]|nr:alpha/beta hydrolase [Gammaproteobacteria bacterium]
MEFIEVDGIRTHYRVEGSGPALLMFSPGGFDATYAKWSGLGLYQRIGIMDYFTEHFTCIEFDRRECGRSGGRLELLSWESMARQGAELATALGFDRVHVIGGCLGCAPAAQFALQYPDRTLSTNLIWPVGGARYRMRNVGRFTEHLNWVAAQGIEALVSRALASDVGFAKDALLGPWGSALRVDPQLREAMSGMELARYQALVSGSLNALFMTDSAAGPGPEALMQMQGPRLVIPGDDESHARSAGHFVAECLPGCTLITDPVAEQTRDRIFGAFDQFYAG